MLLNLDGLVSGHTFSDKLAWEKECCVVVHPNSSLLSVICTSHPLMFEVSEICWKRLSMFVMLGSSNLLSSMRVLVDVFFVVVTLVLPLAGGGGRSGHLPLPLSKHCFASLPIPWNSPSICSSACFSLPLSLWTVIVPLCSTLLSFFLEAPAHCYFLVLFCVFTHVVVNKQQFLLMGHPSSVKNVSMQCAWIMAVWRFQSSMCILKCKA